MMRTLFTAWFPAWIAVALAACRPASAAGEGAGDGCVRDPADHALFFLPTAFTPPRNSFLFRDFELIYPTFGFAPTGSTTLTAGLFFPPIGGIQFLAAGIKQQVWSDSARGAALAITGNISKPASEYSKSPGYLVNTNAIAGWRIRNPVQDASDGFGLHASFGYLANERTDERYDTAIMGYEKTSEMERHYAFGIGAEVRLTRHIKFIGEYLGAAPMDDFDSDFDSDILTVGFRVHGPRFSADISGMRDFAGEVGFDLMFTPLLVLSCRI